LKKSFLIIVTCVIVLLGFYYEGCVPSKPSEEAEILPVERLVKRLEANRRRVKNFEGTGTLTLVSQQLNTTATFKIAIQKPDSIYLTIMGPFGIEIAQSLVTKDGFQFYDALHNNLYKGDISDDVLKSIFKINLPFQDLLNSFVGSVSLADRLYNNPTKFEVHYDNYIMTYTDSLKKTNAIYKIGIKDLGITEYTLSDLKERSTLEAVYNKFKIFETVAVPYSIEVKNLKDKQTLTIDYKKIEVNKKSVNLQMDIPEDANVIKW